MDRFQLAIDDYKTNPSWGVYTRREPPKQELRMAVTDDYPEYWQDDFCADVGDCDNIYLMEFSKNRQSIFHYVSQEYISQVLDEYDADDLVEIIYSSKGKEFKNKMANLLEVEV